MSADLEKLERFLENHPESMSVMVDRGAFIDLLDDLRAKRASKTKWPQSLDALRHRRTVLLEYLRSCVDVGDWHAVSDAANDLRCIDVAMEKSE